MAEYIERDIAAAFANNCGAFYVANRLSDSNAFPAADVSPVVRCKDCAHRTEMGNCGHPRYHGILPSAYPYDFCSYGARKDGDDDAEAD